MSDTTTAAAAVPAPIQSQIDDLKAKIADPATPPTHVGFFSELLRVILKFLPVVLDIFHVTSGGGVPVGGAAATTAAPAAEDGAKSGL